ncbi:Hypothetical predicted protein [Pelobates cultripes]|uniref:Uncharacterized protein n=1 Tax=Pelobates cultripes TaxID=61616 RepID=A0AAD1SFN5_PELCU|nr:Hypothetical predicted protein [Pelobates cultripes]
MGQRLNQIAEFLREFMLTSVSTEAAELIESPIDEEEISNAIKLAKIGKSLGPDGFSVGYYKKFAHQLVHQLTKVLNVVAGEKKMYQNLWEPQSLWERPGDLRHLSPNLPSYCGRQTPHKGI